MLERGANALIGRGGALLDFHAATEDANQRQAHERDGNVSVDALRLPVVDRSHLQIVLGDAKRSLHLPQAVINVQHRLRRRFGDGQTGVDVMQAVRGLGVAQLGFVKRDVIVAVNGQEALVAATLDHHVFDW